MKLFYFVFFFKYNLNVTMTRYLCSKSRRWFSFPIIFIFRWRIRNPWRRHERGNFPFSTSWHCERFFELLLSCLWLFFSSRIYTGIRTSLQDDRHICHVDTRLYGLANLPILPGLTCPFIKTPNTSSKSCRACPRPWTRSQSTLLFAIF